MGDVRFLHEKRRAVRVDPGGHYLRRSIDFRYRERRKRQEGLNMDLPKWQVFLTPTRQADLFAVMKWLLFFVAPVILIWVALAILPLLIEMIRGIFTDAKRDERGRDKDDDDYDVYRY